MSHMRHMGKRLRGPGGTGTAKSSGCCCGSPCDCPSGLETTYSVTFTVSAPANAACDGGGARSAFTGTATITVSRDDFFTCYWFGSGYVRDSGDNVVAYVDISLQLRSCAWHLSIMDQLGGSIYSVSRASGATPEGGYDNQTVTDFCSLVTPEVEYSTLSVAA